MSKVNKVEKQSKLKSLKNKISNSKKRFIQNLQRKSENKVCGMIYSNKALPFVPANFNNGETTFQCLVDSGSAFSIIKASTLQEIISSNKLKEIEIIEDQVICSTANSSKLVMNTSCILKIKIEIFSWKFRFLIADNLPVEIILGCDFIEHSQILVNLIRRNFFFDFSPHLKFPLINKDFSNNSEIQVHNIMERLAPMDLSHLSYFDRSSLEKLISKHADVLTEKIGSTDLIKYDIKLTSNKVVRSQPYSMNPIKLEYLRKKIQQLLDEDIIEPSTSQYSSPCLLVPKPTPNSYRLCIDYRRLNKVIELQSAPLGNLHECFHYFSNAKWFSCIDLTSAYNQIHLTENSKHLTAFITPFNLYQFKRLPYGISCGSAVLTNLMQKLFGDLRFKGLFFYLDDLIIYTDTLENHWKLLDEVFCRLKRSNLTVNPQKCNFAANKINFLGHLVSHNSISIDPERTKPIVNFPVPTKVKGIERFLGMVQFFSKFIPNLAQISAPLNALRKKNAKFIWNDECQKSFDKLKQILSQPPLLKMADFNEKFILSTDASSIAIGCVLGQMQDGAFAPIAYASRTLSPLERKYSTYEKETLAALYGVEKFKYFLEHTKFILRTDCNALQFVLNHPKQLGRIGRWVLRLSAFQFTTEHVKGVDNKVADCLSRMFEDSPPEVIEQNLCSINLVDFPLSFTDISTYQKQDEFVKEIMQSASAGNDIFPYQIKKGILVCNVRNSTEPKIVLPQVLKPMVCKYYHESLFGAHLGYTKTLNKIKQVFTWKGISKDVGVFIKNCKICALSKPAQKANYGYMASSVASYPMEKLFIDFVGKLPRSSKGNCMIFSCLDAFSKYCWLIAVREANANTVCNELQRIFTNFGVPKIIVSDNGPQFKSNIFNKFCFQRGILHVTCTPYHPQSNAVERVHRNLKSALIAFSSHDHTKWDVPLSWLPLAFNCSFHESSKYTPYELIFRHKPTHPLTNIWVIDEILPQKFSESTRKLWKQAHENLLKSQSKAKERFDLQRSRIPFKTNDRVFLKANPISRAADKISAKLAQKWSGPFIIKEWTSPVSVKLFSMDGNTFIRRAHVSQLKLDKSINTGDT